jgi:hypothetical protein
MQLVSKCQVDLMIDVAANLYDPSKTERGMMCRRHIYDASVRSQYKKTLIEREMRPKRLPVRSPRETRRALRDCVCAQ